MQKSFKEEKATLYVVSTPIGNLKDITYRAVEILSQVDLILAEDTRTSSVLLSHYHINKPLLSYHEFNKAEQEERIIKLLEEGKHIALISDAGTPGISDPGYEIIKKVIETGFYVVAIPGASAILSALVTSGLIIQPFTFIGFLPRKQQDQITYLSPYINRRETLIIYESPQRIDKTLKVLYETLGNRNISITRELTKAFETIIRTDLEEAVTMEMNPKGEYVIVIEGSIETEKPLLDVKTHYLTLIEEGYPSKEAMKIVAKKHEISKNDVYKIVKID
ncbi:MAG TPA: 16S rRNA (cytidine(1402)-2'-O)-methyltransferase [Acholeplasmataceae bacterium]|jgi:16S rRNA (cytidine1402-2'-O)-methyltransferase|nr:16S rRNA (cytidine(1402)-2'-O)-methyltransferase [Acholeplasmataceae bacterium]HRX44832.1 16S rRNA (cytidine(1402)-2'-O)-methyltransferase [Acholeplasmataceae bacterium]